MRRARAIASGELVAARKSGIHPCFSLCRLNVAQRNSQRVGRVCRLRRFGQPEQRAHHLLHLLFSGIAVARNVRLDLARRIASHRHALLRGRQQHHATNFRQPQRRLPIERRENGFHRDAVRCKFLDQLRNQLVNAAKMFVPARHG